MTKHLLNLKSMLRGHPGLRRLSAHLHSLCATFQSTATPVQAVAKIQQLCSALRLHDDAAAMHALEASLLRVRDAAGFSRAQWTSALTRAPKSSPYLIKKGVILKPRVSAQEPGIIFISFEHQWAQLLRLPEVERLAREFTLIVSPTWSPPHSALNVIFPEIWPDVVHSLISHETDLQTLPRLSKNYRMIPLLASNWVNEEVITPRPKAERDIDLVMVANFAPFKRHIRLFQVLKQLPKTLKIVLIGQHDGGRDDRVFLREAAAFGVKDRFELKYCAPHEEVLSTLARARASIVLSLREGSCVAVVESIFADTPVGLVELAHIGSARYLNEHTGMFLREAHLAEDIMQLLARSPSLHPRQWALREGIGARGSSEVMNTHLKSHALAAGRQWTRDLATMHWCPNPRRMDSSDDVWADTEHARVTAEFGVRIGRPAGWDTSLEE